MTGSKCIFVLGASGTIGRATVRALVQRGHDVVCFVRSKTAAIDTDQASGVRQEFDGATIRIGDVTDPLSLARDGFQGEHFDILVSCMASRTGAPKDAWAIDHQAHLNALNTARHSGIAHMVLLSAICVQKPQLAFQHAKLAFEDALIKSGMTYTIVRPTAYFKSLSGQTDRLKKGKPYLVFGDGRLTACKPISAKDLGTYMTDCLEDRSRWNQILPIGGPGKAITPKEQGAYLFQLLDREPRFRHVPLAMFDTIIKTLGPLGRVLPGLAEKAELARIGRYYASESMLVFNHDTGRYDEDATPSFGSETLFDYYERLVKDEIADERGEHAVF